MPHISKNTAAEVMSITGFEGRYQELGGYTVGFESCSLDGDPAALFKGLPDDRCQCPHWGFVLKGKIIFHYADESEVITAGQAYYARPGHTPELFAGTETVEFSPTDLLQESMAAVAKNIAAAGA